VGEGSALRRLGAYKIGIGEGISIRPVGRYGLASRLWLCGFIEVPAIHILRLFLVLVLWIRVFLGNYLRPRDLICLVLAIINQALFVCVVPVLDRRDRSLLMF
jgi:hypothetical protein